MYQTVAAAFFRSIVTAGVCAFGAQGIIDHGYPYGDQHSDNDSFKIERTMLRAVFCCQLVAYIIVKHFLVSVVFFRFHNHTSKLYF